MIKKFIKWYLIRKCKPYCATIKCCADCPFGSVEATCGVALIHMALDKINCILERKRDMKNGHANKKIEEITAYKILRELLENRRKNEDGKVHIHEIKDGHISKECVRY